jgi:membrane-bound lytic murein transglycosylase B
LRGSGSGAFGYPQFLPTSYLRYGTDGDGDGIVDLYDSRDAAASCANYLASHGWKTATSDAQRRAVIWRYNHSAPYVDTVLTLAGRIERASPAPAPRVRAAARRKTRPVRSATNVRRPTVAPDA